MGAVFGVSECPIALSCLTLCDPMGCSPPVLHYLQVSKKQGRETFSLMADSLTYTPGAQSMVNVMLSPFPLHPPPSTSPPLCSAKQDKALGPS